MHAHHRADLVAAIAACVHDDLGADVALFGVHGPTVVLMLSEPRHRRMAIDLRPGIPRASRQCLTQLRRVNIAIQRVPEAANQIVRRDQRMPPRAFCGIDHLEMHIHPARHRGEMAIALHLRLGIGQPDATIAMMIIDRIVGILCQFLVEVDRMRLQPDHRLVHSEIRHLRCRMPRGARGQLIPLNQDDIGPAFLRQMIEGRTARNPAANDNNAYLRFHREPSLWGPP